MYVRTSVSVVVDFQEHLFHSSTGQRRSALATDSKQCVHCAGTSH